jgi:hypothetical protein
MYMAALTAIPAYNQLGSTDCDSTGKGYVIRYVMACMVCSGKGAAKSSHLTRWMNGSLIELNNVSC